MVSPSARPSAIDNAPPSAGWSSWGPALSRFAEATSLVVSARDVTGSCRLGPFHGGAFSRLLSESGLWREGAAGDVFERQLSAQTLESGRSARGLFADQLVVHTMPVRLFGELTGVVSYGWVLEDFATSMGIERLGKLSGAPARKLWSLARLETPTSERRMQSYGSLLATLVEAGSELREAIGRLDENQRARELFLAYVSHELRTPLMAISARVELLLASKLDDPESVRASLDKIKRSVREETRLVEDLLDAAVSHTGQFRLNMDRADLLVAARAAHDAIAPIAQSRGVALSLGPPPPVSQLPLRGDGERLTQAIWNLLSNAVKFTPPGAEVSLRLAIEDGWYTVAVLDQGPGIDDVVRSKLFQPFAKQTSGNKRGLGLGLSIVKQIVELHGGRIEVTTPLPDRGTQFTIYLPIPEAGEGPSH